MTDATFSAGSSGLARLAERVTALTGWRRMALAFACGLVSAAAFAPLYLVFLLVPAFAGLIWLLEGASRGRGAFAAGWSFGVGHFLGGLYWVGIAMTVDFERFWWFLPISVGGLSLGLALFTGAACWLAWRPRWPGLPRVLLLGAAWILMEWLRSWVLSGFPWNLLGTVWAFSAETLQLASVTGVWGLSLLTLLAAATPALLFLPSASRRRPWRGVAVVWGLLLLTLVGGTARLALAPAVGEAAMPDVTLRLVQPSVQQSLKWRADQRQKNLEQLLALTGSPGYEGVTHVVWPETAIPYNLWEDEPLRQALGTLLAPGRLLVTGAPRYLRTEGTWNSLYAIDETGRILDVYDKSHLVPFGEYVPFREFLGNLNITVTQGSFEAGPGPVTLALPGLPAASPLICYEIIFPGAVTAAPRPALLLNLTNDAWFGRSSGPFQHLAAARLRTVEEGLPLIRSANNGVSAVLDGYGRFWGKLQLDAIGVLDSAVPHATMGETIFAVIGNWVLVILVFIPVVAARALIPSVTGKGGAAG